MKEDVRMVFLKEAFVVVSDRAKMCNLQTASYARN